MDNSYYTVQFDTARELLSNNNPEGTTGLYAIYNSLANSHELEPKQINDLNKTNLHKKYAETITCVYLVFFTTKMNQHYNGKTISRIEAYLKIQEFKQQCYTEITHILQLLLPDNGIEWRMVTKTWTKQ